jgi:hypothetical protein
MRETRDQEVAGSRDLPTTQTLELKYTKFTNEEHLIAEVVRGDLTPSLGITVQAGS